MEKLSMLRRVSLVTLALLAVAMLLAVSATAAGTVKFVQNADHSPLVSGSVVGTDFVEVVADGALPANTTYNRWCFYFHSGSPGVVTGPTPVTTNASGGLTTSIPLATLTGNMGYPGTAECDLTVPGSQGLYGQYAVFSDGFDAYNYGRLKQV